MVGVELVPPLETNKGNEWACRLHCNLFNLPLPSHPTTETSSNTAPKPTTFWLLRLRQSPPASQLGHLSGAFTNSCCWALPPSGKPYGSCWWHH